MTVLQNGDVNARVHTVQLYTNEIQHNWSQVTY